MAPLRDAAVGDEVVLTDAAGTTTRWRVVSRELIEKQVLPLDRLFTRAGPPRLTLITCGGPFLPEYRQLPRQRRRGRGAGVVSELLAVRPAAMGSVSPVDPDPAPAPRGGPEPDDAGGRSALRRRRRAGAGLGLRALGRPGARHGGARVRARARRRGRHPADLRLGLDRTRGLPAGEGPAAGLAGRRRPAQDRRHLGPAGQGSAGRPRRRCRRRRPPPAGPSTAGRRQPRSPTGCCCSTSWTSWASPSAGSSSSRSSRT